MANFIIIFPILLSLSVATGLDIDYYWKDYYGTAPSDAFVAIKNSDDTPLAYIGQAFIKNVGILPGILYPNATSLTVTTEGANVVVGQNLKVLATQNSYGLRWVKIHYDDIASLKKVGFMKIVEGGFETDSVMYIGRQVHEGTLKIGKIYTVAPYEGLTLANKDAGDHPSTLYKEFEILVNFSCW